MVSNTGNTPQRLQVLTQIPQGSIPLGGAKRIRSTPIELAPYSSHQISYDFYFPEAGEFDHYGAQVSNDTGHIASTESTKRRVLASPDAIDEHSWAYVADWGTSEQVLAFLRQANLSQLQFDRIAWRLRDRGFFDR